jgi:hypothetical protein
VSVEGCSFRASEKRAVVFASALTPALFSAPLTAESCNWMKDLLIIKSGFLNSNLGWIKGKPTICHVRDPEQMKVATNQMRFL